MTNDAASAASADREVDSSAAVAPLARLVERIDGREVKRPTDRPVVRLQTDDSGEDGDRPHEADTRAFRATRTDEVGTVDERDSTAVISKRNYCEQCQYFNAPPKVRCGHAGTEISEFVDREHLLVSGCPIVEERGG